jgi:hypothetical protein
VPRHRRVPSILAALSLSTALAACGSSGHKPPGPASVTRGARTRTATLIETAPPTASAGRCATAVAATLGEVAGRIYREAATGGGAAQAVAHVRRSRALAAAISADDAKAARSALDGLLVNQVARIEILQAGRVLASAGAGAAIAPVRGVIPGTDASFVLSVQSDDSYLTVARQVTGADVLLLSNPPPGARGAPRRLAGTIHGPPPAHIPASGTLVYRHQRYATVSLAGAAYPSGSLRIVLLAGHSALRCAGAQTRVVTLGRVGERVYEEELHSGYVLATRRRIEADAALRRAVVHRDTAATHAAIAELFAAHIHVVRVRVNVPEPDGAQRFFYDRGGPYVLAPVHGTLRSAGKLVGLFSFAIQDDAGYLKLAHLFTGADVLMRRGSTQVMGTLQPGPPSVPDRGRLAYRGHAYQAYSFTGEAFPNGPLRISLLIGPPEAVEQ